MKEKFSVSLLEPQIVENIVREGVEVEVVDIQRMKEENLRLTNGKPYVVLVVSEPYSTITQDALQLIASRQFQQLTKAKALLVTNLPHRIIGNFYMKLKRPAIKTKLFNDRDKAMVWLRSELKK